MKGGLNNMAKRDKTGPKGKGPRTGRGFGKCKSEIEPTEDFGRGIGLGRGIGRGKGRK